VDPFEDTPVHGDGGITAFALGGAPIAAAVTLIDRDCVFSIVAHSLGALISADLLHFLKKEPDEALRALGYGEENQRNAAIQIRLFTFGNPLRQLLNRFFPHIYWWVREEPDNGARPVAKANDELPIYLAVDSPYLRRPYGPTHSRS
jgi:hypothetical protein